MKPSRTRTRALAGLLAVALPLGAAQAAPAKKPAKSKSKSTTYVLPGDRTYPEGIAVDREQQTFYVSSTTDGSILRGAVEGRAAEVFLPGGQDGRTTAIGLKVDRENRLYVAGGGTGAVFVYDLRTRALIRKFETGTGGFINDLTVTKDGDVYVTDSQRPLLFRITAGQVEQGRGDTVALTPFVNPYPGFQAGAFNANGIQAIDRDTLVYVDSNDGDLYRVDLRDRRVTKVDLGGATVKMGDGLALRGRTLYVVRNAAGVIAEVRLGPDARTGRLVSQTGDPTFRFPTTAAFAKGRLLVVNSQFDKRPTNNPELPFTVSSVKKP